MIEEQGSGKHLLKTEIDEIGAEYDQLINGAKNQKEVKQLKRRRDEDIADGNNINYIEFVRNMIDR